MKKYKVLFCDLDGTLIDTLSGEIFPKGIWDMKLKFDVLDAIKKLAPEYVFIATNQGGIENGFVNVCDFEAKLNYVKHIINEWLIDDKDFELCSAFYCGINDKECEYRKPNVGMLKSLYSNVKYLKEDCLMIGDASGLEGQFSDSDKKTAENFGIDYMDVNEFIRTYN